MVLSCKGKKEMNEYDVYFGIPRKFYTEVLLDISTPLGLTSGISQ